MKKLVELHEHLGILKNTREVREALSKRFSRVLQKFPRAYRTQECTRRVFYSFNFIYTC